MELFQFRLHHFRISEVQLIFMCCRFSRVISSSGYSACNRDYFSLAIIVMYNHTRVGLVEIKVRNKVFPLHKIRYGLAHNPEHITCNVTHPEHDWKAKEFVPSAKISAITPLHTPTPPKKTHHQQKLVFCNWITSAFRISNIQLKHPLLRSNKGVY
jgi:hypothetical protein